MSGIHNTVNIAVIGNNFGARVHVPVFNSISGVNVIGAYSTKDNWKHTTENNAVDAISVAVPPMIAYDVIKTALRNNKHVFCEKPLVASLDQANEIKTLLRDDIIHAIDFEICESPIVQQAKRMVELLSLGAVKDFRCVWRSSTKNKHNPWKFDILQGGGALNNFGSHIFYLLEWIFSEKMNKIGCDLLPSLSNNSHVSANVEFNSFGGDIYINSESRFQSDFQLIIHCSDGDIILENRTNTLENFSLAIKLTNQEQMLINKENNTQNQDGRINLVRSAAQRFIDGIRTNTQVYPNINDGIRIQQINDILIRKQ